MAWKLLARSAAGVLLLTAGCRSMTGGPPPGQPHQVGIASYYHDSLAGRKTASGAAYDPDAATCAHRKLPFGTRVEVRLANSGRSVVCTINDRGPFVAGRVIDLSRALAEKLGLLEQGVAKVELRVLK